MSNIDAALQHSCVVVNECIVAIFMYAELSVACREIYKSDYLAFHTFICSIIRQHGLNSYLGKLAYVTATVFACNQEYCYNLFLKCLRNWAFIYLFTCLSSYFRIDLISTNRYTIKASHSTPLLAMEIILSICYE